mgnify:FL=1
MEFMSLVLIEVWRDGDETSEKSKIGCYLGKSFAMKAFQSVYVKVCMVGPIHYISSPSSIRTKLIYENLGKIISL